MRDKESKTQCKYYDDLDADFNYPLPEGKIPFTPEEYGKRVQERRGKKSWHKKM